VSEVYNPTPVAPLIDMEILEVCPTVSLRGMNTRLPIFGPWIDQKGYPSLRDLLALQYGRGPN